MSPLELEIVAFVARFSWRPMSWQRRAMLDYLRRRDGRERGEAWAMRDLTPRERHCLYRLAWLEKDKLTPSLVIPVKEWLAANAKPATRAEERAAKKTARAEAKKAKARAGEQMRLL
jgi:hypothetical protein